MPLMMGLTKAASRRTTNSKPSAETRVTYLLISGVCIVSMCRSRCDKRLLFISPSYQYLSQSLSSPPRHSFPSLSSPPSPRPSRRGKKGKDADGKKHPRHPLISSRSLGSIPFHSIPFLSISLLALS
ncbi:hypothetical protein L249_2429 [Ophiocordyceps polyrhachis-furcata BCC 54312]|uniref:Uncharacterized protein n=1 Tax=Ophiocordyceps polyrhachis-furcata BCC 54312 TaxID=1330021 RepID=A0A367LSQ1_9HYPO|nr:hypothetical protein L249_2429 [Ophiocordyceps polyrhachis-furcata BCC 54312]